MNAAYKLQLIVIAGSGMTVAMVGLLLMGWVDHLSPVTMRYLLPIPPLSVAAYSFVFAFVRDRSDSLPGVGEMASAVLGATCSAAILFAMMCAAMLCLIRIGARFL